MQSNAHFTYQVENDIIIIVDNNGPVSVTVDAERVIADIQAQLGSLEGKYIIWRDSNGTWDALEWSQNAVSMHPLGANTVEDAVDKLRTHLSQGGLHWSQKDNDQIQRQSDEGTLHQHRQ